MEDLKHSIAELKYVERFLRPLQKVIEQMEVIEGIEKRIKNAKEEENNVLGDLKSQKATLESEVNILKSTYDSEREKRTAQADEVYSKAKARLEKINEEQESSVSGYNLQISNLEDKKADVNASINTLRQEEAQLKSQVQAMKKAIASASNSVDKVA